MLGINPARFGRTNGSKTRSSWRLFSLQKPFKCTLFGRAVAAFFVFCIISGAVYTLNDIVDVNADRIHPKKRNRPIAAGVVPMPVAKGLLAMFLWVRSGLRLRFRPILPGHLVLFAKDIAYSAGLKKVPFLDVAMISAGFVLRVLGGGLAIHITVSGYMLACTALLALFLGFGKRRHEIGMDNAGKQRAALAGYSAAGLNVALMITGLATLLLYIAYTLDPKTAEWFHSDQLWMTTPPVLIGMVRFLQLVMGRPKAESPTQEMLRDSLFVVNLLAWVSVVLVIVYRIRPNLPQ